MGCVIFPVGDHRCTPVPHLRCYHHIEYVETKYALQEISPRLVYLIPSTPFEIDFTSANINLKQLCSVLISGAEHFSRYTLYNFINYFIEKDYKCIICGIYYDSFPSIDVFNSHFGSHMKNTMTISRDPM